MTHPRVAGAEIRLRIRPRLPAIITKVARELAMPALFYFRGPAASLLPLTRLDRRPFCFSRCVSASSIFSHFTASLCVRCDTAVPACSPERKILSLQTAGLWYSTWRLTAPRTVSAFDDGAFVPAAGFCYFTTHTDCDCVPRSTASPTSPHLPSRENCQMWSFCKVRLTKLPPPRGLLCMLALYMFGGGGFLCVRSLLTHRDFCCLTVGAVPPRAHTAVPVTSRKRPCS